MTVYARVIYILHKTKKKSQPISAFGCKVDEEVTHHIFQPKFCPNLIFQSFSFCCPNPIPILTFSVLPSQGGPNLIFPVKKIWGKSQFLFHPFRPFCNNSLYFLSNVSNTSETVFENATCSGVFLTKFEVFEYSMKHCLECLIYLFNWNWNYQVNEEIKSSKSMIIKTGYSNLLHGYEFLVLPLWIVNEFEKYF